MIITPSPMPDELAESYFGRVIRLNGLRNEKEALKVFAEWAKFPEDVDHKIYHIEYLSLMAQMSLPEFVCRHTTLPFRRSIASYYPNLSHGSTENYSMLKWTGMRPTRPGAYFCPACIKDDQETMGMSYWRRDHQLQGVMSCEKHHTALSYTGDKGAFLKAPSTKFKSINAINETWAKSIIENTYIQQYLTISRELLKSDKPIDVKIVRNVLRSRTEDKGWSIKNGKCEKPLLSDLVARSFPREWLATVFPDLLDKKLGEKMHKMDGVVYLSTLSSSVAAYVLASCVLFENADEALNALVNPSIETTEKRVRNTEIAINEDQLQAAYIRAKGQYAVLQFEISENRWHIFNRLRAMGLPNLKDSDRQSTLNAATAFFVEKRSLSDSALIGKISIETLEDFIRQVGNSFTATLMEMKPQGGRGTGVARIKPLTPFEAIAMAG
ncbi:MAG: TniQ family protein [Candidatus Saccharibacteria bacterium]|nr:TniQ family protein [Moraxellaceae bacterium]